MKSVVKFCMLNVQQTNNAFVEQIISESMIHTAHRNWEHFVGMTRNVVLKILSVLRSHVNAKKITSNPNSNAYHVSELLIN